MFKVGDICYVIENGSRISLVEILSIRGGFYTVKFINSPKLSGTRLRRSRLYLTYEDAQKILNKSQKAPGKRLIIGKQLELESVKELRRRAWWLYQNTPHHKKRK